MLVLIAVIVAGTVAYSYVGTQSTSVAIARNVRSHAQARYVAETGLELAIAYIRATDTWRDDQSHGTWVSDESFGQGTFTIVGADGIDTDGDGAITIPAEGDGDLADDNSDPLTLTVTGRVSGSSHVVRAVLTPGCGGGTVTYEGFAEAKASSNTRWITIPTPSETSEGDLLIAAVVTDGNESLAPPGGGGWTQIAVNTQGGMTLGTWWKLAGASEPPTHQFTWGSNEQCYAWIMRFTGHDPADPIDVSAAVGGGSSSSPPCPSVTTTVADTMILRLGGFDDDDLSVDDPGLSGHTGITMDESGWGSGTCSGGAGYVYQTDPGPSGTSNFSLTGSEQYRTVTIAIAPDPNGCSGEGGDAGGLTAIVDNTDPGVSTVGSWTSSTFISGYYGTNYLHDNNSGKGSKSATFTANLSASGDYEVFAWWSASYSFRASNTPFDIIHDGGTTTVPVDQRENGGQWNSLGVYTFSGTGTVRIRNYGTSNYVVADAVRFVGQGGGGGEGTSGYSVRWLGPP